LASSSGCPSCGWDAPVPRPRAFRVNSTRRAPPPLGWLVPAQQWCNPPAAPRPHFYRPHQLTGTLRRSRLRGHTQPWPARGRERRAGQGRDVVSAPNPFDRGCRVAGRGEPLISCPGARLDALPPVARCTGTLRSRLPPSSRLSRRTRLPSTGTNKIDTAHERCSTASTYRGGCVGAITTAMQPGLGDSA